MKDKLLKKQIQELEREAFLQYNTCQFAKALAILKNILKLDPQHSLAKFYLKKVEEQLKSSETPSPRATDVMRRETIRSFQDSPYIPSTKRLKKADEIHQISTRRKSITQETTKRYISPEVLKIKKIPDTVKVMVVDDSALMRRVIKHILEKSPSIKVIGEALHGKQALELIPELHPDVITLDVNMPVMDGLTTLKHIIIEHTLPVIMLSAYTEEGAATTFDCLTYGAVDFICKPSREGGSLSQKENDIITKTIGACQVEVQPLRRARLARHRFPKTDLASRAPANKIIVMGAGEGGYSGFLKILPYLPEHLPCAILAVQYMEDQYFESFCSYLNRYSRILVKKAEDQEPIKEGVCYFTNQKMYLRIQSKSSGYVCQLAKKPSFLMQQNVFNHLLFSAAEFYGASSIGVVLAGKGIDGIEGIRELKRVRGITLARNPKNCIAGQLSEIAIQSEIIDQVVNDGDFPGILWYLLKNL